MRIGPYEVGDAIARGGTSVVYRGRSPDGRPVAVKLVRRRAGDAKLRVDREERIQSSLGAAEGFVPLLDKGEIAEGFWIVMPFLAGGTLRARLERGPLGVAESVSLIASLARAIGRAHELGIVHRDLKPENVLFDAASPAPLIADLGLAKHFASDTPGASQSVALSRTNDFRGTIGYGAPEQLHNAKDATPAADVFALGAILHECLAGAPAFSGASLPEVISRVLDGTATPVRKIRPDVPAPLARVVARALARDPRQRFANGAALAEALEAALREPAGTGRGAKIALLALVAAALLGGAGVCASQLVASRREAAKDDRVAAARRAFETATDRDGWARAAALLDAARSEAPGGRLPAEDERASVAARALAGSPDLAALAREAPRHHPGVDRAIAALYSRALAEAAPIASLLELERIPPPPGVGPRIAARWLDEAVRRARDQFADDRRTVTALVMPFGAAEQKRRSLEALIERLGRPLEAFGRALAAAPGTNRFPRALGPFFSLFRLTRTRLELAREPSLQPAWEKAVAPIAGHPIATWIALARAYDGKKAWSEELVEPAVAALEQLEAAPDRTAHVRAIAQEIMNVALKSPRADLLPYTERCARLIATEQAWNDLVNSRKALGLSTDEVERIRDATPPLTSAVTEIIMLDPDDEDPR